MNKAIIYATALRLFRPGQIALVVLYGIILPVIVSFQCSVEGMGDMAKEMLLGPLIPMLIAYTLVKDEIGNSRSLNDGEYLSLLFTRPLTRANYVVTKWAVCSFFVSLLVLLEFVAFHCTELFQGRAEVTLFTGFSIANVFLNSMGATAVIVLLNSFPPKMGMIVFGVVMYGSMLGGNFAEVALAKSHDNMAVNIFSAVAQTCAFIRSCASPTIDTYAIFNSLNFSWLPVLVYVSNLTLFLTIGVLVLNRREFFYASE